MIFFVAKELTLFKEYKISQPIPISYLDLKKSLRIDS